MRNYFFIPLAALALSACSQDADTPEAQDAPDSVEPQETTSAPDDAPAAPAETAQGGDTETKNLEKSIPESIRGKWRRLETGDPTPEQCKDATMDNAVKLLHIRADGFGYFETGGRLLTVHERSDRRIRATYDTTYADEHTEGDYIFDAKEDGKTLIVREYFDGARPGPIRYRRCPAE